MHTAVHFDDQASLDTVEIQNETAQRMLPPELQAMQPATTQRIP